MDPDHLTCVFLYEHCFTIMQYKTELTRQNLKTGDMFVIYKRKGLSMFFFYLTRRLFAMNIEIQ